MPKPTDPMSKQFLFYAHFSYGLEFPMPADAVRDCHHQGACDADAEHWQAELNLGLDRSAMIRELSEIGAWDETELNSLPNAELEMKLIWIGAGDIQDSDQWETFNAIPEDFPVAVVRDDSGPGVATCGHCYLSWDDSVSTSMTPTPAGRCPFEYFHIHEEQD